MVSEAPYSLSRSLKMHCARRRLHRARDPCPPAQLFGLEILSRLLLSIGTSGALLGIAIKSIREREREREPYRGCKLALDQRPLLLRNVHCKLVMHVGWGMLSGVWDWGREPADAEDCPLGSTADCRTGEAVADRGI